MSVMKVRIPPRSPSMSRLLFAPTKSSHLKKSPKYSGDGLKILKWASVVRRRTRQK